MTDNGSATTRAHFARVSTPHSGTMTVLVDDAVWPFRGQRWAHLVSDHSLEELHAFATELDIPRSVFQGDHYDVPEPAQAVTSRELVRRLRASGLRLPKTSTPR